jgi:hypothetical protein
VKNTGRKKLGLDRRLLSDRGATEPKTRDGGHTWSPTHLPRKARLAKENLSRQGMRVISEGNVHENVSI